MNIMKSALILIFTSFLLISAEDAADIGIIQNAGNGIYVYRAGEWMELGEGDIVFSEEKIRTPFDGFASLVFINGTVLKLKNSTECEIGSFSFNGELNIRIRLIQGGVYSAFSKDNMNVSYMLANSDVMRGSGFFAEQNGDTLSVHVIQGQSVLENDAGSVLLITGESGRASTGVSPYKKIYSSPPMWSTAGYRIPESIDVEFVDDNGDTFYLELETE